MIERLALKLAAAATCFVWAFVSIEYGWGALVTFWFAVGALALGASAAKDLARMGR